MTYRRGSNWRRWRESSWRRSSSFPRRRRRRSRRGITRSTEVPTSQPSLSLTRISRICGNNGLEKATKELEENRFTKMLRSQQQLKYYDFFDTIGLFHEEEDRQILTMTSSNKTVVMQSIYNHHWKRCGCELRKKVWQMKSVFLLNTSLGTLWNTEQIVRTCTKWGLFRIFRQWTCTIFFVFVLF